MGQVSARHDGGYSATADLVSHANKTCGDSESSRTVDAVTRLSLDLAAQCPNERIPAQSVRDSIREVQKLLDAINLDVQSKENMATEQAKLRGQALLIQLLAARVPEKLVLQLDRLCFEAQKDAARVFASAVFLSRCLESDDPVSQYVEDHSEVCQVLIIGCGRSDVFTPCAHMLRACSHHPKFASALLVEGAATRFIDLMQHQNFDIASEAFSCLRELLLTQKSVSAAYMESNFDAFFGRYHGLLEAADYVTRRQVLRLLGEILLDRAFMQVMLKYVGSESFLPMHMRLLRDESRSIQLEAFHVFKVFAANPMKPRGVQRILYKNKEKLLKLVASWSTLKDVDEGLTSDLAAVTQVLIALEAPTPLSRPKLVYDESPSSELVIAG